MCLHAVRPSYEQNHTVARQVQLLLVQFACARAGKRAEQMNWQGCQLLGYM